MELIGWAKVRKTAPRLALGEIKPQPDGKTLEAIIANRYELMAGYAHEMQRAVRAELDHLKAQGVSNTTLVANLRAAKAWLHRDDDKIPHGVKPQLQQALGASPKLALLVSMREELRLLWTRTNVSAEQAVAELQAWCKRAEGSGIAALQEFSMKLRAAHA
jgi:stearoyl-CoA desaturase (delta-9 desaturase)